MVKVYQHYPPLVLSPLCCRIQHKIKIMKYKINTLDIRLPLLLTRDSEIWPAEQKNLMDCYSYLLQQISLVHIALPTLHPSPLDTTPTTFHLNKKRVLYITIPLFT